MTSAPARASRERLLREGATCWRIAPVRRLAFLVDGERYFGALDRALDGARRRVVLLGWDFHSGMRLRRDPDAPTLLRRLDGLARRGVSVHVLEWDFAMIYAFEREVLPRVRFGVRTHRRLRFALDGNHPVGASHHQKLVVIDDAVAFTGGLDLTACRWDTRAHRADDPRRSDPGSSDYAPFHDVGVALDGPAAAALADLAADRWCRATGRRLRPLGASASDPWPADLAPDLVGVTVGLARTEPRWEDRPAVREVEALHLEAIRAARRWVYVENQYLTSGRVGEALAERLAAADGPEVVIVAPDVCSGWLEERTMGVLRKRLVHRLREADRFGRFRLLQPAAPGSEARGILVHSKVLVVDDRLAKVGSSNLSNRSMGLDTELDVALEADEDGRVEAAVARLRNDLLAEHLGTSAERVARTLAATGSLVATVECLGRGERRLAPLRPDPEEWTDDWIPGADVLDPERPVSFAELTARLLPEDEEGASRMRGLLPALLAVAALVAVGATWRWTALSEWIQPERLAALVEPLRTAPWAPLAAVAAVTVAGLFMVPIVGLIVACALVFGPWTGFAVAFAGAVASAVAGYGVGRLLWRDAVHRLMSPRLRRLSMRIARRGITAVAAVRIVPVAPFTAVNLVAGATRVRFRDYLLGTVVAMAPGTLALTALASQLARAVIDPGWGSFLALVVVVVVMWLGLRLLRRRFAAADG